MKSGAASPSVLDDGTEDGHEFVCFVLQQGQLACRDGFAVAEQLKPKNRLFEFFLTVAQFRNKLSSRTGAVASR
jgi:hypothetical protein